MVRNFYGTINADGCVSSASVGPRNSNGGMTFVLAQRRHGNIDQNVVQVTSIALENGDLLTTVHAGGQCIEVRTRR